MIKCHFMLWWKGLDLELYLKLFQVDASAPVSKVKDLIMSDAMKQYLTLFAIVLQLTQLTFTNGKIIYWQQIWFLYNLYWNWCACLQVCRLPSKLLSCMPSWKSQIGRSNTQMFINSYKALGICVSVNINIIVRLP